MSTTAIMMAQTETNGTEADDDTKDEFDVSPNWTATSPAARERRRSRMTPTHFGLSGTALRIVRTVIGYFDNNSKIPYVASLPKC